MATKSTLRLVFNLRTGAQVYYDADLTPDEAVMTAYLQHTRKNWNTYDYPTAFRSLRHRLVRGTYSVSCGDWCTVHTDPHTKEPL